MSAHNALHENFQGSPMADPGSGGTITVDRSPAYVPLASAAAEARTLRRPTREGAIVTLQMKTDGGDITLTVTGGYNEDGDTTFTFSDPGQFIVLVACYDGTNYYWRKVADYQTGNVTATELGYLSGVTAGTPAVSKAIVVDSTGGVGVFRSTGGVRPVKQAAPAAKTVSATLTAAELLAGLVTGNQGAAAAATYTTPTGTEIETAFAALVPGGALANDDAFDFSVINISAVAAETITLAAGVGVTLVGDMTMAAVAVGDQSSGTFRCRRTAANTYSIYRL